MTNEQTEQLLFWLQPSSTDSEQVFHSHMPVTRCSIIWYWLKCGDALCLRSKHGYGAFHLWIHMEMAKMCDPR